MRIALFLLWFLSATFAASLDDFLPAHGTGQVIHHYAYVLEFADVYKQPSWVCYMLCRTRVETSEVPRTNDFRSDPAVSTGSATPKDYSRSGYDKGHLAPSGDFRWNELAQSESFFMSNMSPQRPALNRGIWKHLEDKVREWAQELDTLYVVTGPVLKPGLPTIGTSNVAVPENYYKLVLDYKPPAEEAIGFIMRNEGSSEPLVDFVVTVDSIEKVTGIHFFPELAGTIESKVVGTVDLAFWHLNGEIANKAGLSKRTAHLPDGATRMRITRHNCSIDCPKENRLGAACGDGTTSSNTGKGACAGHGGVECWECR